MASAREFLWAMGRGMVVRSRVVRAIVLREISTRFGRRALGYLWAFVEPLTHIVVFVILFRANSRNVPPYMTMETFLLTGVIPWLMFLNTQSRVLRAVSANKPLLAYPMVMPLDFIVARAVLEFFTYLTVFVACTLGLMAFGVEIHLESVPTMVASMAILTLMGASSGMMIASASLYMPWVEQITNPLLRLLYFVSGVFFTINELPHALSEKVLFNPIAHLIDQFRGGFFSGYDAVHTNLWLPTAWMLTMLLIGLMATRVTGAKAAEQ